MLPSPKVESVHLDVAFAHSTEFCSTLLTLNLVPGLIQLLPSLSVVSWKWRELRQQLERTTERNGDQGTSSNVPMSSKPLHHFVQKEPRCLGIVSLMFGCAELLMGFQLFGQELMTSTELY
ncbi:unnamed protein product [Oreochromis niloticus]|nr:unnamed protein product [Mustela putorius furo]